MIQEIRHTERGEPIVEALVGWSTQLIPSGFLLRLQMAHSRADLRKGEVRDCDIVLTANQMRLLAEYLTKTVEHDDKPRTRKTPWWKL